MWIFILIWQFVNIFRKKKFIFLKSYSEVNERNSYSDIKLIPWTEFESWIKLLVFLFALILLGKVLVHHFSPFKFKGQE